MYFGPFEGEVFASFTAAGNSGLSDKMAFFQTDAACAASFGASAPGIALHRNFENSPVAYSVADGNLQAWAEKMMIPMLIEFSDDFIEPIFGKQAPALILFSEGTTHDIFTQAASALKGSILFVHSGVSDGIQSRLAEFVGVTKTDLPCVRLIHPGDALRKFTFSGDVNTMTVESIKSFIDDFKADRLKPFLKSEAIPTTQEGHVQTLVGLNFQDVVMDRTKDVLVKFYAPWCGHCKKLVPIWDELAEKVKDMPDLIIAKFDATANEADGVDIRGYPTLKWYPKNDKSGVSYEGDRELENFLEYLAQNSDAFKAGKIAQADAHTEL